MAEIVRIRLPGRPSRAAALRAVLGSHSLALEWKPQDLWVGLFWKVGGWWTPGSSLTRPLRREVDVWLCVVPMLPVHLHWVQIRPVEDA